MSLVLGADVGGTHVRLCAVRAGEHGPQVIGMHRERWADHGHTPQALAATIDALAERALAEAGHDGGPVPLGIGLAAQLSADGRVVRNAPNMGWRDLALADALERDCAAALGGLVLVNDLDAILAGELAWGAAVGHQIALAVYVGTGVGGAFSVGGRVVRGASGNAGEIGHVKLRGFDGACGCGERGCVEALAGGVHLQDRVRAAIGAGVAPAGFVAESGREVAAVDAACSAGDPWATALWDEVADGLAYVISGACTLLNPSILVLGGGVFSHAPGLRARVVDRAERLILAVSRAGVTMRDGALGDRAGLLGAAAAALGDPRG